MLQGNFRWKEKLDQIKQRLVEEEERNLKSKFLTVDSRTDLKDVEKIWERRNQSVINRCKERSRILNTIENGETGGTVDEELNIKQQLLKQKHK